MLYLLSPHDLQNSVSVKIEEWQKDKLYTLLILKGAKFEFWEREHKEICCINNRYWWKGYRETGIR